MRGVTFLCCLVAVLLCTQAAYAVTVTVSDVRSAFQAPEIPVTITVKGMKKAEKISGIDLELRYDQGLLEVKRVEKGPLTKGWNLVPNMNDQGVLKITLFSPTAFTASSGTIAVVYVALKEQAAPGSLIPLQLTIANFNEVPATTIKQGTITVRKEKK